MIWVTYYPNNGKHVTQDNRVLQTLYNLCSITEKQINTQISLTFGMHFTVVSGMIFDTIFMYLMYSNMSPSILFMIAALSYSLSKSLLAVLLSAYSTILYHIYVLPGFEQPVNLTLQQGISPEKNDITTNKHYPYKAMSIILRTGFGVILYRTRLLTGITKELNAAVVRISGANLPFNSKDPLPDIFLSAT